MERKYKKYKIYVAILHETAPWVIVEERFVFMRRR